MGQKLKGCQMGHNYRYVRWDINRGMSDGTGLKGMSDGTELKGWQMKHDKRDSDGTELKGCQMGQN